MSKKLNWMGWMSKKTDLLWMERCYAWKYVYSRLWLNIKPSLLSKFSYLQCPTIANIWESPHQFLWWERQDDLNLLLDLTIERNLTRQQFSAISLTFWKSEMTNEAFRILFQRTGSTRILNIWHILVEERKTDKVL